MANRHQFAKLREGVGAWNEWRKKNRHLEIDLSRASLNGAELSGANLINVNLTRARLTDADLSGTKLQGAVLVGAQLSETSLIEADLSGAKLSDAKLINADLTKSNLSRASLSKADLSGADLSNSIMAWANLSKTNLKSANLSEATLGWTNLSGANLREANLSGANLCGAALCQADLTRANLNGVDLSKADLSTANLFAAKMNGANFSSAKLQHACFDRCVATDIKLWETQRAGWSIKGIVCERAFWDEHANESMAYAPGEFERLYSDQTCIELFYEGGVSTFELNTLPALLHHLASLHPDTNIRLKSLEETGGGAKISISIGDTDPEKTEKIKSDAMQVYQAQLALRDKDTERLQIERDYIERLFLGRLIPAILSAGTPQNVFNAPVTGVVISSGESKVDFHQTVNDNSAVLAVLERILTHRMDLGLTAVDAAKLEFEIQSASTELQKQDPEKSILSKSLGLIQKLAAEAATRAAGKLGEAAAADWQTWLHQLGQFVHHLK